MALCGLLTTRQTPWIVEKGELEITSSKYILCTTEALPKNCKCMRWHPHFDCINIIKYIIIHCTSMQNCNQHQPCGLVVVLSDTTSHDSYKFNFSYLQACKSFHAIYAHLHLHTSRNHADFAHTWEIWKNVAVNAGKQEGDAGKQDGATTVLGRGLGHNKHTRLCHLNRWSYTITYTWQALYQTTKWSIFELPPKEQGAGEYLNTVWLSHSESVSEGRSYSKISGQLKPIGKGVHVKNVKVRVWNKTTVGGTWVLSS